MEVSSVLFCLFFLLIGLVAIGTVKRTYVERSGPVDMERLRNQQSMMVARRAQRERNQSWFKISDESLTQKTSFGEPRGAKPVGKSSSTGADNGDRADEQDAFSVARVDEAFKTFLRGRL